MRYYIWYLITSEPDMIDIANVFGSLGNSDFNFCNLQVISEFKIRDELSETNGIYYYKEMQIINGHVFAGAIQHNTQMSHKHTHSPVRVFVWHLCMCVHKTIQILILGISFLHLEYYSYLPL